MEEEEEEGEWRRYSGRVVIGRETHKCDLHGDLATMNRYPSPRAHERYER